RLTSIIHACKNATNGVLAPQAWRTMDRSA
ncbi:MAG: hypothetical protein ACI8PT_004547, partial [Gammaproteobacteria bacterium]